MQVLGIDPGLTGAVALVNSAMELLGLWKIPSYQRKRAIDANLFAELIKPINFDCCFIELVAAMPGQGVSSMFSFGYSTGMAHGIVAASGKQIHVVRPQEWKKYWGLIGAGKEGSVERAKQLWPDLSWANHNLADACLIASYGAYAASVVRNSGL